MRCLLPVLLIAACAAAEVEPPRTGRFQLTFTERSPLSAWAELSRRYGWGSPDQCPPENAYEVAADPYDVFVPKSYDGSVPYGLIAYVNSGRGGGAGSYGKLLEARRLIWIGHTHVENDRDVPSRIGLTIDAVHNLRQRYRIDPERIYVCGTSGGGRTASMMGVTYADVFTGGAIYLIGCNDLIWPQDKTARERVEAVVRERRFAFMTGSKDFNQPGTKQVFDGYQAAKIPHIRYFETPGLGHANPPEDWFAQALDFVDGPLMERAREAAAQGDALAKQKKPLEAFRAYQRASASPIAADVIAEVTPKLEALRAGIDAGLAPELDRLLAKPEGAKLRAFAAKWADFPRGATARTQADAAGDAELAAITARPAATQASALRRFLQDWDGYPAAGRALAALDALARPLFAPLAAQPAKTRTKALARFAQDWAPTPTAREALALLDADLGAELTLIGAVAVPMQRAQKLRTFAATWKDRPAGQQAQRMLEEMIAAAQQEAGAKR